MQALYAYFQHEKASSAHFEKEMYKSLDKIYDLYLSILSLIGDLHHVALMVIDENRNKRLPGKEDLNPNMRFVDNALIKGIAENKELSGLCERKKISWQNDFDLVRKIYNDIRAGEVFKSYMAAQTSGVESDRNFVVELITAHLSENEVLLSLFEDKNIHWADDTFVAFNSVIRTVEEYKGQFNLQPLLKDEKDDLDFMGQLFNKTILYKGQFDEMIDKHASNWELERIANMDMLLMEMAIAEILYLPNVPVKASLNEYIDISKEYSTPNSKVFVNGVLDKIIAELKQDNRINKTGRGLKEN